MWWAIEEMQHSSGEAPGIASIQDSSAQGSKPSYVRETFVHWFHLLLFFISLRAFETVDEADTLEQLELFLSPEESDFAGTVVTLGSGFTVIVTTDGAGAGEDAEAEAEAEAEGLAEAVGKIAEAALEEELGEAEADALAEADEDTTVPESAESVLAEQDETARATAAPRAGRDRAERVKRMGTPRAMRRRIAS